MFNSTQRQNHLPKLALRGSALLLIAAAQSGCRNAAYNDLYAESMASEIRQLEDTIYDYDNEYHILEQENERLKAENQQLLQKVGSQPQQSRGFGQLLAPKSNSSPTPNSAAPLQFEPRETVGEMVPEPLPSYSPPNSPPSESLPPKKPESILEPPGDLNRASQLENSLPQYPNTPAPNSQQNQPLNPPLKNNVPEQEMLEPLNIDPGTPITIVPGTPLPPGMPVLKDFTSTTQPNTQSKSAPANNLELNLSRIEVPNQLASASGERAQLKLGSEKPADMRIVELAFHPTLTRAANFDDLSDDDGLYLVLQPKNVEGQLVPTFASLEIAVHDPARIGSEGLSEASRIGRWTYSANEVKSKFQPIGTNQGIHLTLPWNGPDPQADRVQVFIRYTLPDGRQVINDKTIFVSGKGNMKTVWVPRSDSSAVVTAGAQQSAESSVHSASNPTKVVRPQGSTYEPAPTPR